MNARTASYRRAAGMVFVFGLGVLYRYLDNRDVGFLITLAVVIGGLFVMKLALSRIR